MNFFGNWDRRLFYWKNFQNPRIKGSLLLSYLQKPELEVSNKIKCMHNTIGYPFKAPPMSLDVQSNSKDTWPPFKYYLSYCETSKVPRLSFSFVPNAFKFARRSKNIHGQTPIISFMMQALVVFTLHLHVLRWTSCTFSSMRQVTHGCSKIWPRSTFKLGYNTCTTSWRMIFLTRKLVVPLANYISTTIRCVNFIVWCPSLWFIIFVFHCHMRFLSPCY